MKRFVEGVDRGQSTLFPERLDDWIGEDNPVRVIDVFADELDLGGLGFGRVEPQATGRPGYHPSVLLKLYIYPTFPICHPNSWNSYHFPTAKGTVSPMQPSDGMILVIGPRLEGHSVIFLAIQTHLSCRFLLAVDSLGLRRSGSSSQIINQAQDFPEQVPRHRHLSQLERNVAAMSDNLGPDLHQLVAQRRHRPVLHLLRQSQCPHEVAQIVGQGVKLEPNALLRNLRHDRRVQLMAFLPSLMCCSAVPR